MIGTTARGKCTSKYMSGYRKEALLRYSHKLRKVRHQPYTHSLPAYGQMVQYEKYKKTQLSCWTKKVIRLSNGQLAPLYHARVVDLTMLVVLSEIAIDQSAPTGATTEKTLLFLGLRSVTSRCNSRSHQKE